ncbi:MAG TPA: hypothetical protein VF659_17550 [Pyrinomonadaceae bacterium]
MSELNERRWAVLSERGREAGGLSYGEASGLVARLRGERVSGLCVITDEAASHVRAAGQAAPKPAAGGARPRRAGKKKAS